MYNCGLTDGISEYCYIDETGMNASTPAWTDILTGATTGHGTVTTFWKNGTNGGKYYACNEYCMIGEVLETCHDGLQSNGGNVGSSVWDPYDDSTGDKATEADKREFCDESDASYGK